MEVRTVLVALLSRFTVALDPEMGGSEQVCVYMRDITVSFGIYSCMLLSCFASACGWGFWGCVVDVAVAGFGCAVSSLFRFQCTWALL